jgi:hypothetical protein
MVLMRHRLVSFSLLLATSATAQEMLAAPVAPVPAALPATTIGVAAPPATQAPEAKEPKDSKWYDKLALRGYTQIRYNNLFQTDPRLTYPQNDKGIGGTAGFTIRRARLQVLGDVHPRVYLYFQSDFAADAGTTMHVAAIRDLYADIALDDDKEFRFRVGQSKVPFGFENMQSSSNRAPLDRTEAINSATPGERDLGLFFYWAPKEIRARFKHLVDSGLKGSGDYGVVAIGTYNGQAVNKPDLTPSRAVVARVTWPFDFGGQFVEVSAQAMDSDVSISLEKTKVQGVDFAPSSSTLNFDGEKRAAATVVVYPQPIGFQAEATVGRGPVFDLDARGVKRSDLFGYYGMLFAKFDGLVPYLRYAYYEGSRRTEVNAMPTDSTEIEGGIEYQVNKALEITAAWQHATRFNAKLQSEVSGDFGRVQVQLNY